MSKDVSCNRANVSYAETILDSSFSVCFARVVITSIKFLQSVKGASVRRSSQKSPFRLLKSTVETLVVRLDFRASF